jgi:cell shape-determining protein MreC
MNRYDRLARKEVFASVPETCPKVDAAMESATKAIKDCTELLRERWLESMEELLEARDRIYDLEKENEQLKKELESTMENAQ